jgi:hypothetical protein
MLRPSLTLVFTAATQSTCFKEPVPSRRHKEIMKISRDKSFSCGGPNSSKKTYTNETPEFGDLDEWSDDRLEIRSD